MDDNDRDSSDRSFEPKAFSKEDFGLENTEKIKAPGLRGIHFAMVAVLSLIVGGIVSFGLYYFLVIPQLSQVSELGQNVPTPASVEPTPSFKRDRSIESIRDLNDAFVSIAEDSKRSVVTVFTERVTRVRRRNSFSPFSGNPFFDQFFRDFMRPRGQSPGEEPFDEQRSQGLGSGVIVSENGLILTNNHVIQDADKILVRTIANQTLEASVIGADPHTDIAVIKVNETGLTAIPQGDSDELRVGEFVLAIGSPMSANLAHTVTQGIVSAKGRSNVGLAEYEDFIQTDAAVNPGNSGGALINLDGELVGINTAIVSRSGGYQGISFAVPINMARTVMEQLIENGEVVRAWMGVSIQDINEDLAAAVGLDKNQEGVIVADTTKGGPADLGGIKPGDVLLSIDGEPVKDGVSVRNRISATAPGTKVSVKLLRESKELSLEVTLTRLPSESEAAAEQSSSSSSESLQKFGFFVEALSPAWMQRLGIKSDAETSGVVVAEVKRSSNAARAGLLPGDIIESINRKKVNSVNDFQTLIKGLGEQQSLLLQIYRRGSRVFLAFSLG